MTSQNHGQHPKEQMTGQHHGKHPKEQMTGQHHKEQMTRQHNGQHPKEQNKQTVPWTAPLIGKPSRQYHGYPGKKIKIKMVHLYSVIKYMFIYRDSMLKAHLFHIHGVTKQHSCVHLVNLKFILKSPKESYLVY